MIRRANYKDVDQINLIGTQLHDNFAYLYRMEETLNTTYSRVYVYEEEAKILGFIHVDSHFEIMDLINIIVLKDEQGKGIGSQLVDFVVTNEEFEKIMLEVRENNANAIHLYEKFGFKEIYRRKKYYGNEDAIIMERMKHNEQ